MDVAFHLTEGYCQTDSDTSKYQSVAHQTHYTTTNNKISSEGRDK